MYPFDIFDIFVEHVSIRSTPHAHCHVLFVKCRYCVVHVLTCDIHETLQTERGERNGRKYRERRSRTGRALARARANGLIVLSEGMQVEALYQGRRLGQAAMWYAGAFPTSAQKSSSLNHHLHPPSTQLC